MRAVSLTTFLVRRLSGVILVILGITLVTFVTLHIFPADPARLLAGPGRDDGSDPRHPARTSAWTGRCPSSTRGTSATSSTETSAARSRPGSRSPTIS